MITFLKLTKLHLRLRAIFIALTMCATFMTSVLAQECAIDSPPTVALAAYDPTTNPVVSVWKIRIRAVKACQASLVIENLQSSGRVALKGNYATENLLLEIASQANAGAPVPMAPTAWTGLKLLAGQEIILLIWLRPDASQWISPGFYQQTLAARLLRTNGETIDYRETQITNYIKATANAQFGVSTGTGGSQVARFDFGELQRNASRSATLDVLSNAAHSISISSSGNGRLVNKQHQNATVPWALRINGQSISLSAGSTALTFTAKGRIQYTLEARIGEIERLLAGDYADDLLITIMAQ